MMNILELFRKKKVEKPKVVKTKEIECFILSKENNIKKLTKSILNYCEIYGGEKEKSIVEFYRIENTLGEDEIVISLNEEIGIYNVVNMFCDVTGDVKSDEVFLRIDRENPRESFFAHMEKENEWGDTMIGLTNRGRRIYTYLPETFSLDSFDVSPVEKEEKSVDIMLERRGLKSIDYLLKERKYINDLEIELSVED